MPPRRTFRRKLGERRYRKIIVIATEGKKTEPQYFAMFKSREPMVKVKCLEGKIGSSPTQVLQRMNVYLREESLKDIDEAWLVVDKDSWTDEQLTQLYQWSQNRRNYGFALSNPKFELWLLLHFDDPIGVTPANCIEKLNRYLPNYDKGIDVRKITLDHVLEAIRRAKQRDNPPCTDWPRNTGSTVYKLVEKILA